uniref:CheY chemotaxis protein or a CheY-like REC (Receiver) domain n=1 Tax=Candidatus Kentrum sp. TC TaxID=2126339 RepID=A0A450YB85_9GAMM|nr:MAG: CheY chemotaxis protein or a CheY-like REC (receiver) domain [Candidatus Kentron sp. TC]
MMETKRKLLVIDDSAAFREAIELTGEDCGWEVYADDALQGVKDWLGGHSPDVVLFDWQLPGQRRERYAELLRNHRLTERTLLLSGAMDKQRREFVAEYGLAGAKLKPFDLERFEDEIRLPEADERGLTDGELVEIGREIPVFFDILDRNLDVVWSNKSSEDARLTSEQRLIAKWLQVDIEKDKARNIVRRLDWDGERGRFLESKLHRISSDDRYVLERDWRGADERLHDHELLNLEGDKNLTLGKWLQAVARLLAQRYAISRLRVYKIAPLSHVEDLESEHAPLVAPKFQSGGGIEPDTEAWLRGGFQPECIAQIKDALESDDDPAPRWVVDDSESRVIDKEDLARVAYGDAGTFRVLFPVRVDDRIVALLALDRRLDHARGLQGFDKEVVELARRMASDEAGALNKKQWPLMRGLVKDIGERVRTWLQDDEERRTANWRDAISRILIETFAETMHSPEMTYEGISQVCAKLVTEWNQEEISGVIQGSTPWSQQAEKGSPISDWYIVLTEGDSWRLVAGWGNSCEICRRQGGKMSAPVPRMVTRKEAWRAVMIQEFQVWSKGKSHISPDGAGEMGEGIGAWLAVPMQAEGRIRAAMVVHSPHAHYFTAFHTRLMEVAARQLLPLLTAALRETRARSAFAAAVMHEVKNDSHAALMSLDQVRRDIDKKMDPRSLEYLMEIRHHLEGLNALGQDSLDIFRVGRGEYLRTPKSSDRDITTTLGDLLENAARGWCALYEDTEFRIDLSEELAGRRVRIPRILDFKRVLRVLLHNAFRHGRNWVRIAVELQGNTDTDGKLQLTVRNGAYDDVILGLGQTFGSATDNPGASPLIRGRMGLAVAKQLTLEVNGVLSELQYQKQEEDWGEATITLYWPIKVFT